ncbi:MAG: hypothetical protein IJZ90_03925, partial [Clostridia bacterium]|nr:hypothetical protein [Clostridia bacterium]
MKKVILRNFCVLIVLAAMLFSYTGIVYATETGDGSNAVNSGENEVNDAETSEYDAEDITDAVNVSYDGSVVKMSCDSSFCQIYIEWKTIPGEWNLYDGTSETAYGTKGFLHEYVSFESGVNYAEIRKSDSTEIRNIYFFTDGTVPDWVQVWDDPCKKADIMLCSTHSDDEQLFFLGILPYYAGELGLNVQVVYFVNHNDAESRPHELLNGLWTVGVRNYPMIGEAPDLYSENLDDAIAGFADYGYSEDFFIEYQVEAIRRFKPLVVIGHDVNGEYSHGAHILNTHTLRQALEISNDASVYPGSAEKY